MENPFDSIDRIHSVFVEFMSFIPFDVKNSHEQSLNINAYRVNDGEDEAELRFKRIYSKTPGIYGIEYAEGGKLEVDRYGQLSRSMVTVCFTGSVLKNKCITEEDLKTGNETHILLDLALHFFGRFTRNYAEATDEFWVNYPTRKEIVSCHIEIVNVNERVTRIQSPLLAPVHFSGGKGHFISEDQDKSLRNKNNTGNPDQVSQLLLSARDFHYKGQYELTIVQCSIAFEYFVYNSISNLTSKKQIKKRTKNPDCGCHVGVTQLCKIGLKDLFDIDFGSTDEFDDLSKKVLRIRNLIVHGDSGVSVSDEAALSAITITESAISCLANSFEKLEKQI